MSGVLQSKVLVLPFASVTLSTTRPPSCPEAEGIRQAAWPLAITTSSVSSLGRPARQKSLWPVRSTLRAALATVAVTVAPAGALVTFTCRWAIRRRNSGRIRVPAPSTTVTGVMANQVWSGGMVDAWLRALMGLSARPLVGGTPSRR